MFLKVLILLSFFVVLDCSEDKTNLDLNNEFFSLGSKKKTKSIASRLENSVLKSKVDVLGEVLKEKVDELRQAEKNHLLELIFLVDASSSVGQDNFASELKFVRKLLADFTISSNHTRVALVTFSSADKVIRHVDQISGVNLLHVKCELMNLDIDYSGGGTYTLGAVLNAQKLFSLARPGARCVLFLVTDGFSNGGDPRPIARELKASGVVIFTFGISTGNTAELFEMASTPSHQHSFLLDSFSEFEALARRALHQDLATGHYIPVESSFCEEKCSPSAVCGCGLRTGFYACLCPSGYYGPATASSLQPCIRCPNGTYSDGLVPGDITVCIPCPDVNHVTRDPAKSEADCYCKEGFKSVGDGSQCEMVHCPDLDVPENGHMVHGWCNTLMNAACGIRCNIGYSLVGSSIRLCLPNGTWSGLPTKCVMKRCPRLENPENGHVTCSPDDSAKDLPLDAECFVTCNAGYSLIGSQKRTCLPLSKWDGRPNFCKAVHCSSLPQINNGYYLPENCTRSKKHEFGKVCRISCLPGYELQGADVRKCSVKGIWTHKRERTTCLDVTPPTLQCPADISMAPDPSTGKALVRWIEPEPMDNSNESVLLWSQPSVESPMLLGPGKTVINYTATDASFNQITCNFSIVVTDDEPPIVENCDTEQIFLITVGERFSSAWVKPDFHDNSDLELKISESHRLEELPVGITNITYTATDSLGNNASCTISVEVIEETCEFPNNPLNGRLDCSDSFVGMTCSVICNDGYSIAIGKGKSQFFCNSSFSDFDLLPDCTETELPNNVIQEGELSFESVNKSHDVCDNHIFLNQVKSVIHRYLASECEESHTPCLTQNDVKTECENDIPGWKDSILDEKHSRKRRRIKHPRVKVQFTMKGKKGSNKTREALQKLTKIEFLTKAGIAVSEPQLILHDEMPVCSTGFVIRGDKCVQCPSGTFWLNNTQCNPCALGWYQPKPGQSECLQCPQSTSTRRVQARSARACRAICPPGTYSRGRGKIPWTEGDMGVKPCLNCPLGTFQPNQGALSCKKCSNNTTTKFKGSTLDSQCIASNSSKGEEECIEVRRGRVIKYKGFNCSPHLDLCLSKPCQHAGTCWSNQTTYTCSCAPGFIGKDCQDEIDECASAPCQNGGECLEAIDEFHCQCPSIYQGQFCENKMDECSVEPCALGSKCSNTKDGYRCECGLDYSGRNCEVSPCDDPNQPCLNNGICHSHSNSTHQLYWCECVGHWSGIYCNETESECASAPCLNSGTCIGTDDVANFTCSCSPGYYGRICETYVSSNFSLNFPIPGTLDYARIRGPSKDLHEISLCIWLQSSDKRNYGTLFSYATNIYDNAFTLTDYNGLVLYVNGRRAVTDAQVNDGAWHSVCVKWTSIGGIWSLYLDGLFKQKGTGLSNNTKIPGDGVVVVGQDQDRLGGGFNPAEAFVGRLAGVDLWDFLVRDDLLTAHAHNCSTSLTGNVVTWSQLYHALHGNVQVEESPLCKGCNVLNTPQFATLELEDNIVGSLANYTCDPGYVIGKWGYSKQQTRKCLKDGSWQGSAPICQKCYCGFPGYFPHGKIIGNKFYFQDVISYECNAGFKLIGPYERTCLENGSWTEVTPTCQADSCSIVAKPAHGLMWLVVGSSFHMEFECERGFLLEGPALTTCLDNGQWDSSPPQCLPVNCSIPERIRNFVPVLDLDIYQVGVEVNYTCDDGYELDNTSLTHFSAICNSTGNWVHNFGAFQCVQSLYCAPFENTSSKNSSAALLKFKHGDSINIDCSVGFKAVGPTLRVCQRNGTWSGPEVACQSVVCPSLFNRRDDFIIDVTNSSYGGSLMIQCKEGYELLVDEEPFKHLNWTCNKDGVWHGEISLSNSASLKCLKERDKQCFPPDEPENGYVMEPEIEFTTHYPIGKVFNISCRQGFMLKGDNYTECLKNGTWSHSSRMICEAVECSKPIPPANTILTVLSDTKYGSLAQFKCIPGFREFGLFSVHCQANGKWSRVRGKCLKVNCNKPPVHPDAEIYGDSYLYNAQLKITCPEGTMLKGNSTITCLSNGLWSDVPQCTHTPF